MRRGQTGPQLRFLLAALVLTTGASPPVRFGHTHAHHGEHSHFLDTAGDDQDDADHHPDGMAVEDGSFHWHDGLLLLSGPLTTSEIGQRVPVGPGDPGAAWGTAPPVSVPTAHEAIPLVLPDISWLPPPGRAEEPVRPPARLPHTSALPLIGSVLIRC